MVLVMIELSKLTNSNVGRRVRWFHGYLHESYLAARGARIFIVDGEVIGGRAARKVLAYSSIRV